MKDVLFQLYRLPAVGFFRHGEKSYKVKCEKGDYWLKFQENNVIETIYERIVGLHLDNTFVIPIRNVFGNFVSQYENQYFLIEPWYEHDHHQAKEVRLRMYLIDLALLHQKSYYILRVNDSFFEETHEFIKKMLQETKKELEDNMAQIEKTDYKSPSQWLFLTNFPVFFQALKDADGHLDQFDTLTKEKKTTRMALVYANFAYEHVFPKTEKIIATDHMRMAPLIYDLKDLFDKAYHGSIDISGHIHEYLNRFRLLPEEIEWLCSLILIPQFDFTGKEEVDRIVQITNSLHHLHTARDLEKILEEKNSKQQQENVKTE